MPKPPKPDLLQGTLDLLILKTLSLDAMHGWAISQRIKQISKWSVRGEPGIAVSALHRLERAGWIGSEVGSAENNRQVKIYKLTRLGRSRLNEEKENWNRVTTAVARILEAQ
jgi:transcriptional regulator